MDVSGQKVNVGKSCFFLDKKQHSWAQEISEISGFQQGILPFNYLGVPIFQGRKKTSLFMFIRDKISARMYGWSHRHLSFGGRLTLIKSILGAIPIHIFQALDPTKGALRQIEQVMARFLWGSCNSNRKTHWIKWEQVCLPTDEGGLGIRSLGDMVEAFSIKMWWRFREHGSLWAQFLFQKYCSVSVPLVIYRSQRFSPMWRRLFKVGSLCRAQTRWVLGDGNISFWHDAWVRNVPLAALCNAGILLPNVKVSDLWEGEEWNEMELWLLAEEVGLADEVVEEILKVPFDRRNKDKGRWKPTGNGNFSTSSAWELVRNKSEKRFIHELIWGKCISPSISMFLWRLFANRIPVDLKLQWRGISLASKCKCCENPSVESRLHLFSNGEVARRVWRHFERWFPQVPHFEGRRDNLDLRFRWWQRHLGISSSSHVCVLLPCFILWFIWTERNEQVHREKPLEAENVIKRVLMHMKNLVLAKQIGPDQWRDCCPKLEEMNARTQERSRRKVGRVEWRPPDPGWVKLNVDGAFRPPAQGAGGGGIVRDSQGEIVVGFSTGLLCGSALEAEVSTILAGIILAKQHGDHLWIESDAEIVVRWLATDQLGAAETCVEMEKIRKELQGISWKISHIFREGNKAADFLAEVGLLSGVKKVYSMESAPGRVKALCRLDQLGFPNFRF